jgi:isopentenyl-diphosphate delta-isomerase
MPDSSAIGSRKADHIRINLDQDVRSGLSTGLDQLRFIHEALPEIDLDDIDLGLDFLGKYLQAPILISSMTGGTERAEAINRALGEAAQATGIALGVGSQRAMLEHPELQSSFRLRDFAPNAFIFANLGAVQLNYGYGVDDCRRAVELIKADALFLHLNSLQEAIQPEGDTRFGGLVDQIGKVSRSLGVPVVVKEVGWGISERTARLLADAGVTAIDVAGAGGTSWSQVEMYRLQDKQEAKVAAAFHGWGIPTAESILRVRQSVPEIKIIASGGLRDGVDIAKCIGLGAELGGMAGVFLKAAVQSSQAVINMVNEIRAEIKICMFGVGAKNHDMLKQARLVNWDGKPYDIKG